MPNDDQKSFLITRNITVLNKRTSVRLEPEMWRELKKITEIEQCTLRALVSLIYLRKEPSASLTASIRIFVMLYYKAASTKEGHDKAGHGNFTNMLHRSCVLRNRKGLSFIGWKDDAPHKA